MYTSYPRNDIYIYKRGNVIYKHTHTHHAPTHPYPEKPTESDCNMSSRASEFKRRKNTAADG